MDEFAREWTYRTPLATKTYPKGWAGTLPADERKAAEDAGVLVVPELVEDEPAPPKRTRKKAE